MLMYLHCRLYIGLGNVDTSFHRNVSTFSAQEILLYIFRMWINLCIRMYQHCQGIRYLSMLMYLHCRLYIGQSMWIHPYIGMYPHFPPRQSYRIASECGYISICQDIMYLSMLMFPHCHLYIVVYPQCLGISYLSTPCYVYTLFL